MKIKTILAVILSIFLFSCRNQTRGMSEFVFPQADSIPLSEVQTLTPEAIADISKNISSPVEIADLLQRLKIPFSKEYLATSINASHQSTAFDKAIKLGILGADLGYLNMYEKTGSSLDVLSSIRQLAEDIKVGQFFDFELIKKLSENRSNLDSLLYISIHSYNKIDEYLRNNDRGQLSALMIIGVWMEGQYIATQVINRNPDKMLSDRIGEQKIILNDLILLLSPYCRRDNEFKTLCNELDTLKARYRDVRITYTQGEPKSVEKNGRLEVVQTETSQVEMTKEQLDGIIEQTRSIRDRVIAND